MRLLIAALLGCLTLTPAAAQSSLGISGAELALDLAGGPEDPRLSGRASLTVAVTAHHGLQGDLVLAEGRPGDVGTLAAHLYMTPLPGQKYGLFTAVSDMDSRALAYASLGAEGLLALDDRTTIEARAGIGWARWEDMTADFGGTDLAGLDRLDYVFAGAGLTRRIGPATRLEAALAATQIDERTFAGIAWDAELRAVLAPAGRPWSAHAALTRTGLTGGPDEARTSVGLGLTFSLGATGGTAPEARTFRTPDSLGPLLRTAMR